MKPIGPFGFDARTTAANAAWRARALEKPKAAADLHGKSDSGAQQQPFSSRKIPAPLSSQGGTEAAVPFRHAPRLTAAFTAQLLGQILPDPERPSARVYRERFSLPNCLDTKL